MHSNLPFCDGTRKPIQVCVPGMHFHIRCNCSPAESYLYASGITAEHANARCTGTSSSKKTDQTKEEQPAYKKGTGSRILVPTYSGRWRACAVVCCILNSADKNTANATKELGCTGCISLNSLRAVTKRMIKMKHRWRLTMNK